MGEAFLVALMEAGLDILPLLWAGTCHDLGSGWLLSFEGEAGYREGCGVAIAFLFPPAMHVTKCGNTMIRGKAQTRLSWISTTRQ